MLSLSLSSNQSLEKLQGGMEERWVEKGCLILFPLVIFQLKSSLLSTYIRKQSFHIFSLAREKFLHIDTENSQGVFVIQFKTNKQTSEHSLSCAIYTFSGALCRTMVHEIASFCPPLFL